MRDIQRYKSLEDKPGHPSSSVPSVQSILPSHIQASSIQFSTSQRVWPG